MNFWVAWFDRTVPIDQFTGKFDEAGNITFVKYSMDSFSDMHKYLEKECVIRGKAGQPASYVFSEIGNLSPYLKNAGWVDPYA